jgi:hypothetical protein
LVRQPPEPQAEARQACHAAGKGFIAFAVDMCGMADEVATALLKHKAVGNAINTGRGSAAAGLALPLNLVLLINLPPLY